jgi:alpha-L-fucosidase
MRTLVARVSRALCLLGAAVLALSPTGTASAATPAQVIVVSPNDSPATIIANAANVVPSARQLSWTRLETMAFIHFGAYTFDGREWGTGTEDPNIFAPTGLNTDQWAVSLRDGGFKGGVLPRLARSARVVPRLHAGTAEGGE